MKVLLICSKNSGKVVPFISEQADSLASMGVSIDWFFIEQKGIIGYLRMIPKFLKKNKSSQPDVIHAHYGLCGLVANMQRKTPVVTTYPGSDINTSYVRFFSILSMWLSRRNIFMGDRQLKKVEKWGNHEKNLIIPYGIDLGSFYAKSKEEARKILGFTNEQKIALFAGRFSREVKNAPLAFSAVNLIKGLGLHELTGNYSREEMCTLMNAVDVSLMTSFSEGSPQFIKETLACGCPVVSVDVGDVKDVIAGVENCYIAERNPEDIAAKLEKVLAKNERVEGSHIVDKYDLKKIANELLAIYISVLQK